MESLQEDTRAFMQQLAAASAKLPRSWELPLAQVRAGYDSTLTQLFDAGRLVDLSDCCRVEDCEVPGPAGPVPLRVYRPASAPPSQLLPGVVYFHGGGWTQGSLAGYDGFCRTLCGLTGALVVSVDYRLAPEHPFPAAFEDSFAAVRWLAGPLGSATVGLDAHRLAVAGDSAGGNLAAACAQAATREGLRLRAQLLLCPVTDCAPAAHGDSYSRFAEGFLLTAEMMRWFIGNYAPLPEDRRASPVRVNSVELRGAAPALVVTADHDPLRDEGRAYFEALRAAGVDAQYREFVGQVHVFWMFGRAISGASQAMIEFAKFLQMNLEPASPDAKL